MPISDIPNQMNKPYYKPINKQTIMKKNYFNYCNFEKVFFCTESDEVKEGYVIAQDITITDEGESLVGLTIETEDKERHNISAKLCYATIDEYRVNFPIKLDERHFISIKGISCYDDKPVYYTIENGQVVRSGQASQVISMTDKPQAVTIQVVNGGASTTYTIYLQRRPSEKRTRVSAGYINNIYLKGTTWRIDADLVTIKYSGEDYNSGNLSTFTNGGKDSYDYEVDPNCIFYYGTKSNCYRATNISNFMNCYRIHCAYLDQEIEALAKANGIQ